VPFRNKELKILNGSGACRRQILAAYTWAAKGDKRWQRPTA
jgi:hypothetical protein